MNQIYLWPVATPLLLGGAGLTAIIHLDCLGLNGVFPL